MDRNTSQVYMMPESPFIGWVCGSCGKIIFKIEDGRVEWLVSDRRGKGHVEGLRIVHTRTSFTKREDNTGCRYDVHDEFRHGRKIVEGLSLERFVGPDGLMLLLSFLAADAFPRNEILELIKRVQIPGYERSSPYAQDAIEARVIVPAIGNRYFLQSEIKTLLKYGEQKRAT
jgi:hypothetical protein